MAQKIFLIILYILPDLGCYSMVYGQEGPLTFLSYKEKLQWWVFALLFSFSPNPWHFSSLYFFNSFFLTQVWADIPQLIDDNWSCHHKPPLVAYSTRKGVMVGSLFHLSPIWLFNYFDFFQWCRQLSFFPQTTWETTTSSPRPQLQEDGVNSSFIQFHFWLHFFIFYDYHIVSIKLLLKMIKINILLIIYSIFYIM